MNRTRIFVILIVLTTVMSLCGCQQSVRGKDAEDRLAFNLKETELKHKLECHKFAKGLEDDADKYSNGTQIVEQVFYSKKINTCIVEKVTIYIDAKHAPAPGAHELYEIDDILEGTQLWSSYAPDASLLGEKQISELK